MNNPDDNDSIDPGAAAGAEGGLPPEKVEDRPKVGVVSPSDYPEPAAGALPASDAAPSAKRDSDMEYERLNPGSGSDSTPD